MFFKNIILIYTYNYNNIFFILKFLPQSSDMSKHVPDKIHLAGDSSSILRLAVKTYVGPLYEVT